MAYKLDWVTGSIAVGMAPMSYDALDSVRAEGVSCILNLCAEFCDLHWIEVGEGFEVYYLPVHDECAPDPDALEKALDWVDEAVHLGKKVLIHCRHGVGRTGTVMTAYLLRRGLSRKSAARRLARARIGPANFSQWWFLRRFARKSVPLTIREPSLEPLGTGAPVNLAPFFARYEELLGELNRRLDEAGVVGRCGEEHQRCCRDLVELSLVEAVHLSRSINSFLANSERAASVERAAEAVRLARPALSGRTGGEERAAGYRQAGILCPLNEYGECQVFDQRPPACRLADLPPETADAFTREELPRELERLSDELRRAYATGGPTEEGQGEAGQEAGWSGAARFTLPEVVSGRWVASFFDRFLKGGGA